MEMPLPRKAIRSARTAIILLVVFNCVIKSGVPAPMRTVQLSGNLHPLAQPRYDRGRLPGGTPIGLVTIAFRRTAAQQADLDRLLENQRSPASPDYHRWLTPEQYATRFGVSAADIDRTAAWLRSQGLVVEHAGRARTWISFRGTAAQIEAALHTEFHRYQIGNSLHYAAAVEPWFPEALTPPIASVSGLDDFDRPRPLPLYNSSDGAHLIAPDDFAAIYVVSPLYSAGVTGSGVTIAIAASSDILLDDIRRFRSTFGLAPLDPQFAVYGADPGINSAQGENTGDMEVAMGVARGANFVLVASSNVFNSLEYAVDEALADIISLSGGTCEELISANAPLHYRAVAQQANAQGITIVNGAGDTGATLCEAKGGTSTAGHGLAVAFPSSIPEITSVGGTEFVPSAASWSARNGPTGASALGYIPELAWNETGNGALLFAGGGGASALYPKPAWQTGPGVPNDGARDLPDVSFIATCSSNQFIGVLNGTQQEVLCGTSASGPAFAGVVALLNQFLIQSGGVSHPGLGNVNPALYRMAQTTPSAFHDITSGSNAVPCQIGTPDCLNGTEGYPAGPGYDLATGLGSLDVFTFVTNWSASGVAIVTAAANPQTVPANAAATVAVTVSSASGGGIPTGIVTLNLGNQLLASANLANASASIVVSAGQLASGANAVTAVYSGDAVFNASATTFAVTVSARTAGALISPSISPDPVYQSSPDADGDNFQFTITLTESAGVAATLTGVAVDGASQPVSQFFASSQVPAHGAISAQVATKEATVPATHTYTFSGTDATGAQWMQQATAFFYGPRLPGIAGVSNAASGSPTALAPGSIASVYGLLLAPSILRAESVPLPLSLGGVTATVNGIPAPLYFVSPGQVNLQIPYEVPPGAAIISVNYAGQQSISARGAVGAPITLLPAGPGIFVDANGNTVPYASGSRGQVLTLFITGAGAVSPPVATGSAPAPGTSVSQLPAPVQGVSLTIGGIAAPVIFSGVPSGLVGVVQINFQVPNEAPVGSQPVVVTIAGKASRAGAAAFNVTP